MALRFPLRMVLAYLTGHLTPRPSLPSPPSAVPTCCSWLSSPTDPLTYVPPHTFISRLGDEATATLDTARRQPHRLTGHRGRPRHARRPDRILARLPQLLRNHPLQPLALPYDGGVSAESRTAPSHQAIRRARASLSVHLSSPCKEGKLLPAHAPTEAGRGARARSTRRSPRHGTIPFVWCNARRVLVCAQSGGRTGFRDGNEGVRFFVVV
jgi:hypothetical protein